MTGLTLRVQEFGLLRRDQLGTPAWKALRALDARRQTSGAAPLFDWNVSDGIRARNLVGVVQVPGASIEIVPKLDLDADDQLSPHSAPNLIFMLRTAREVPVDEIGTAFLRAQKIELLDVFVRAFAANFLMELEKGLGRAYSRREDELTHVKGQILIARESLRPPWSRQRVWVRWDEYDEDTVINRCIKAACRRLSRLVRDHETAALVGRILDELDFVSDRAPTREEIRLVSFDRLNRRFERAFAFASSVLHGDAPSPKTGELPTISLVFPMERLFESFVARAIEQLATSLGLERRWIHRQAAGRRLWLLTEPATGRGAVRLKPDLVIDRAGENSALIIDTKWKRLRPSSARPVDRIDEADIYQAVSYAIRYGAREAVLLFPASSGCKRGKFLVPGTNCSIRIELIDLNRDLARTRSITAAALHAAVWGS